MAPRIFHDMKLVNVMGCVAGRWSGRWEARCFARLNEEGGRGVAGWNECWKCKYLFITIIVGTWEHKLTCETCTDAGKLSFGRINVYWENSVSVCNK